MVSQSQALKAEGYPKRGLFECKVAADISDSSALGATASESLDITTARLILECSMALCAQNNLQQIGPGQTSAGSANQPTDTGAFPYNP